LRTQANLMGQVEDDCKRWKKDNGVGLDMFSFLTLNTETEQRSNVIEVQLDYDPTNSNCKFSIRTYCILALDTLRERKSELSEKIISEVEASRQQKAGFNIVFLIMICSAWGGAVRTLPILQHPTVGQDFYNQQIHLTDAVVIRMINSGNYKQMHKECVKAQKQKM
jgi:hypothetical protein